MQVKEGGTSLHKTFRGINLAFKGLMVVAQAGCPGFDFLVTAGFSLFSIFAS